MSQENRVNLRIFSEKLTPDEITSAVGMQCDRSWKIGDLRGKTIIKEKENGWEIGSGLPKDVELDEHLKSLFQKIEPYGGNIYKLSAQCDVCISCGIISNCNPPLFFDKDVLSKIAALGASMDLDTYVLNEI